VGRAMIHAHGRRGVSIKNNARGSSLPPERQPNRFGAATRARTGLTVCLSYVRVDRIKILTTPRNF